jgi:hypothetical protein
MDMMWKRRCKVEYEQINTPKNEFILKIIRQTEKALTKELDNYNNKRIKNKHNNRTEDFIIPQNFIIQDGYIKTSIDITKYLTKEKIVKVQKEDKYTKCIVKKCNSFQKNKANMHIHLKKFHKLEKKEIERIKIKIKIIGRTYTLGEIRELKTTQKK